MNRPPIPLPSGGLLYVTRHALERLTEREIPPPEVLELVDLLAPVHNLVTRQAEWTHRGLAVVLDAVPDGWTLITTYRRRQRR